MLEDDLSLGETIKELLLENDYEVDYVTKGNDVIEITFDKEYDLYIFDINVPDIDGLEIGLRQRIEKQLNKVESANRFSKAVFFGNNAEFIFATQEEQNIANNCKRLIQNAVILWNYLYIDKKLQEAKSQSQKDEIIEAIKNSSIVHWSHINFYGTYDFTKIDKKVNEMIS
ncbi:Tn3 family transposase [Aliarcobacter butzleri]|uniref:Tn3 family transposase n=1 Tax=Aliarcobacter butzleri TaxID=28197 RepID=UPI002B242303|nr:Tn3 family transposase [Aliarcobacter butzleri]